MTKKTISGYTRQYEQESNALIPNEIEIVILHFHWIAEKFTLHGDNIKLNEEGNIATMIDTVAIENWNNKYYTVYGNNLIHLDDEHVSIYKWTFKILHGASRYNQPITIGIDSSSNKEELLNEDFADKNQNNNKFYAVGLNKVIYNWDNTSRIYEMESLVNGDTLSIIFDVDKGSLLCKAKNKTHCIAKNVVVKDVKYNMAVSMSRKDDSVQLISFETQ